MGAFARNYIRFGEKIAVKYADEIIVLSREQKEYFLREYEEKLCLSQMEWTGTAR